MTQRKIALDKKKKGNPFPDDAYDATVVSGTECTGLMQTPPQTEEDAEEYARMYNIHLTPPNEEPTEE